MSAHDVVVAIQEFWAEIGFAAPVEWPESEWAQRWVWTEEAGGRALDGNMPCQTREEQYISRFRLRSTGEGWTQLGYTEALALRDRCIEALEDAADGPNWFGSVVDGIDPVEYSKIMPVRVAGPAGEAAYWEWTITMTVAVSR